MSDFIPYGRQSISEEDIEAVVKVLKSDFLTCGKQVELFEEALCQYTGAKYAVVCSSGTAALHLAVLALQKDGPFLGMTVGNTFLATANCLAYCGGKPKFIDITSDTANMSTDQLEKHLNDDVSVVLPVHFAGHPAELNRIAQLVESDKQVIIEDACHALGAQYGGERIGNCRHSTMAVFSFHPVKHITTGEGGAIMTNDEELAKRMRQLRCHGMTRSANDFSLKDLAFEGNEANPWYYEMSKLGFNYRLTDIQCALGTVQLGKLEANVRRRREIAQKYREAFAKLDWLDLLAEREGVKSSYHLFVALIDYKTLGLSRRLVMKALRSKGIGTQVHYIPVYRQPFYQQLLNEESHFECPNTESYYERCLSLPIFPTMNDEQVERVVAAIKEIPRLVNSQ